MDGTTGERRARSLRRSLRRRLAGAERQLAAARDRLDLLFETSPEPIWVFDLASLRVVDVNAAAVAVYGWSRAEFLGLTLRDIVVGSDDRALRRAVDELPPGTAFAGEWQHRRRDGSTLWVAVTSQLIEHDGRPARLGVIHDVTAQRESEARVRAIVDNAADGILTIDLDGVIESANPAAERMFGYSSNEIVGSDVRRLMVEESDHQGGVRPSVIDLRTDLVLNGEATGLRRDGSTFPLELAVTQVELGDRAISTVVARDITERKAFERRLTHQGTHDPLTGLPNRMLLLDRLAHGLAAAERTRRPLAVLFCDVDRFKVVNDSLGHTAGDALLFAVAARFRNALRTIDTVARFGGDEFVVLAEDLADEDDAVVVARKLAVALEAPIEVAGQEIHVTTSIGIAVSGDQHASPDELLRDADVAMYRAKANGRARYELFDAALRTQALERLDIESALRRGMGLREFVVHFQPEISLATGRIVGAEALVRWEHADRGLVSPGEFLPVAEETGLIVPMGEDIFTQACAEASRWHDKLGDEAPTVWVNVSGRQLSSAGVVEMVRRTVEAWLPVPSALGLEITETDAVPDDDAGRRTIHELTELGVRIAIDDFGTGFASLQYLWRFPADVIKVDQSFVQKLDEERDAIVMVKAMIEMAHSLGKTIVAEGVETDEQLSRLRRLGADTVQGYLLHRPLPAAAFEALLST